MLSDPSDINPYLQQEVLCASPLRLRWMLIQRSVELCGMVDQLWSTGQDALGSQWLLRVREILGELLDGVQDADNPLSLSISDFYLYLLQLAFEVEQGRDRDGLRVLAELLHFEAETWRMLVEKVGSEAAPPLSAAPIFPELDPAHNSQEYNTLPSGFSLEV